MVPGTPVASFTVAFNGLTFTNNAANGVSQISGITIQNISSGTLIGVRIVGTAGGTVQVERVVVFNQNDDFVTIATRLTNLSGAALSNVATLENLDPDQDSNTTGDYSTLNDVVLGGQFVRASGPTTNLTIGLGSADPRSVVSAGGFDNRNPFDIINSPFDPNGADGDIAIAQAFNFGSLNAGSQTSGVALMVFGTTPGAADTVVTNNLSGTNLTDSDWYSVTLAANQTALALQTTTLGDGPGEFVNLLNPHIELYDSTGTTLIASGTMGPDGRNESILKTGLAPGTYTIRVTAEGTSRGEYFLGVTPLRTPAITITVDNTAVGYHAYGPGWSTISGGYGGSEQIHAGGGTGTTNYAQWQYGQTLTAGTGYEIFATWVANPANASNATYKIYDGATLLTTVTVNQRYSPNSGLVAGNLVQSPFVYTPTTTGYHVIRVQLGDNANGRVVADAVFDPPLTVAAGQAPALVLTTPAGATAAVPLAPPDTLAGNRTPVPVTLPLTGGAATTALQSSSLGFLADDLPAVRAPYQDSTSEVLASVFLRGLVNPVPSIVPASLSAATGPPPEVAALAGAFAQYSLPADHSFLELPLSFDGSADVASELGLTEAPPDVNSEE